MASRAFKSKPADEDPPGQGKRVVWKAAFTSPFCYKWPEITDQVGNILLKELITLLDGGPVPLPDAMDTSEQPRSAKVSISNYRDQLRHLKRPRMRKEPIAGKLDILGQPSTLPSSLRKLKKNPSLPKLQRLKRRGTIPIGRTPKPYHMMKLRSGRVVKIPDHIPPRTFKRRSIPINEPRSHSTCLHVQRPPMLDHVLSGVNTITKALENEIQHQRAASCTSHKLNQTTPTSHCLQHDGVKERQFEIETAKIPFPDLPEYSSSTTHPQVTMISYQDAEINEVASPLTTSWHNDATPTKLVLIFVCKGDLNPTDLLDHLLPVVAAVNRYRLFCKMASSEYPIPQSLALVVPLPQGAETQLATALGIKRAAVVALHGSSPEISRLGQLVGKYIDPILPPNLTPSKNILQGNSEDAARGSHLTLIPAHIKNYKTTAPSDMRKHRLEISLKKQKAKMLRKQKKVKAVEVLGKCIKNTKGDNQMPSKKRRKRKCTQLNEESPNQKSPV